MSAVNTKHVVLCLGIFTLLFLTLFFIREYTSPGTFLGKETYANLRLAESIAEKGWIQQDELSYGSRPLITEKGFPFILSLAPAPLARWLPFFIGLASIFIFYLIMIKVKHEYAFLSTLLLVLNPATLYLYSTAQKYSIALFLVLLALYFLLEEKHFSSLLTLLFLPLFSVGISFFVLLFALLARYKKKITTTYLTTLALSLLLLTLLFNPTPFKLGLAEFPTFNTPDIGLSFLQYGFLSDLGGEFGFATFFFLLTLLGFYFLSKETHHLFFSFLTLLLSFFLVAYFPFLLYALIFLAAPLAASTLIHLKQRDWKSINFKTFTILLIWCGLLFSTVSYLHQASAFQPTASTLDALTFLKQQPGEEVVLSNYENGVFFTYAGKQNVLDHHFWYAPQLNQRWKDTQTLFHTQDLATAKSILNKYDVTYIYVDKTMKQELWPNGETEFLFLLTYSPKLFSNIYHNEEVDIYLVY
ncbi:MAG: hypothetical protein WC595_00850 [Candidatus Nanoarchaeia archaeon]